MTRFLPVIVATMVLSLPLQPSLDEQCADPTYAKLHPTVCGDEGNGFGVGGTGSGGGNGSGIPIVGAVLKGLGL